MNEPNKENLRLWVAALRSGEFEQTTGKLVGRDYENGKDPKSVPWGYCCLGVVCEIAMRNGVEMDRIINHAVYGNQDRITFDDCDAHLPDAVMNWLGIDTADPNLKHLVPAPEHVEPGPFDPEYVRQGDSWFHIIQATAAELNDGDSPADDPLNFNEIADAIEYTFGLNSDEDAVKDG